LKKQVYSPIGIKINIYYDHQMNVKINISQEKISEFCRKNRIKRLSFFGSVIRDDFGPDSDVDVLVEFEAGIRIGLIALTGMQIELGNIIGRNVDLNTAGFLSPYFRDKVISGAEAAYERA
jgi:uncharacterized protein